MAISERMQMLFERSRKVAIDPPRNTFNRDLHYAALNIYKDLPVWEKQARAMAYAIKNQEIYIEPYDKIIGRVYYYNEIKAEAYDSDFDFNQQPRANAEKNDPEYAELCHYQLATYGAPGHITWDWNALLRRGTEGLREKCLIGLQRHLGDEEAEHFYNGVLIVLEALEAWNDKHVEKLIEMGMTEEAEMCKRVPRYPARSFREAVQSFFMQFIVIMKENPYGGNSPGRLDYYLWPYLEADLEKGIITTEEAEELCEELFVRIDERLYHNDRWGESVVLGGCHSNGTSAVNPLTYAMIRAYMKHDIIHPLLYGRIPNDPPKEYIDLLTDYVINGKNRAQLISDNAAI
jgi:formate C-acetyltransferase